MLIKIKIPFSYLNVLFQTFLSIYVLNWALGLKINYDSQYYMKQNLRFASTKTEDFFKDFLDEDLSSHSEELKDK